MLGGFPEDISYQLCGFLDPESFFILHLSSSSLFKLCARFLLHCRKKADNELREDYKLFLDSKEFKVLPNFRKKYTASLHLRELYYIAGSRHPIAFCAALNVVVLNNQEVSMVISHYEDLLSYQLIGAARQPDIYRPHVHIKYSLLRPFYYKHNVQFTLVLETLLTLKRSNSHWVHSVANLAAELTIREFSCQLFNEHEKLDTVKCKAMRRYSSELKLRRRTLYI